ncbi:HU family DNA-binding protein [Enterovirga sp. DB1703]|uniref:HU family DNA-binding protein n=1 Tax=Enterovirga aerilata TaxID=2730920 RepID=A0A849I4W1_9HYPH|nr:HU family DNA-binding protein [Enterovirga sp. DB1703]
MNLPDLIEAMAKASGRPEAECRRHANAFIQAVRLGLRTDGEVAIRSFGAFVVDTSPARPCRNFQTGEPMLSEPKRKIRFKPAPDVETGPPHPFGAHRKRRAGADHAASLSGSST